MAAPGYSFTTSRATARATSGAASNDNANLLGRLDPDSLAYSGSKSNGDAFEFRDGKEPALQQAANTADTAAQPVAPKEDDYDDINVDPSTVLLGSKGGGLQSEATLESPRRIRLGLNTSFHVDISTTTNTGILPSKAPLSSPHRLRRKSIPVTLQKTDTRGRYLLNADDPEIREILSRGLQREAEGQGTKQGSRFSDLVFTRQFTTFDRQNPASASSPFHGFFTLFWLSIFLMLVKLAASNWKKYGSAFGPHEILTMMFHRDVIVLGLTDGLMCASTMFCLLLQKAILAGYLSWDTSGWIIQNVWQTLYLGAIIGWTIHRSWPWTHTVFIVIHCIAMLMKQHSYAFYNGYLSGLYHRKKVLGRKLKQLHQVDYNSPDLDGPSSPTAIASSYFDKQDLDGLTRRGQSLHIPASYILQESKPDTSVVGAAVENGAPLDAEQITALTKIIQWEIKALDEELRGKCSVEANNYPQNLNIRDFALYIPLPTVVYELEYPRQDHIDWYYVAEKTAATFGVLGVMIVVSQAYIYPSVMETVHMKEIGMTLEERLKEFPWVLSDLLFPFMMEYLLAWYVIWECILNVLAEVTCFADRGFYSSWWNSTSWDEFARDWNRPVHNFLLRHVYHSSISTFKLSRSTATLVTFLLSACVHELVMWCIFKKLRGYLMGMQMMQLPLVSLARTKWMRGRKTLGNVVFWVGIFTGPSFLCSLYLII